MSGFTKGPWSVGKKTGTLVFTGSDGGMGDFICEVCGEDDTPREVNKANARLIAAAPELYERLNEARDAIASLPEYALGGESIYSSHTGEIVGDYPIRDELLHHIDAALSKAAGEGV